MKAFLGLLTFLFVLPGAVHDVAAAQQTAPTAKSLPATYVRAEDVQANLKAAPDAATNPSPNIRVVDAGGYNVSVGAIHRPETPPGVAAVHFKVTEVYHVMAGGGTLVTGGTMVNAKARPADALSVRLEDGPGASGTAIEAGVSRHIKAGDLIIIPAGTPHWFSKIDGSITYVVVRVDPGRILATK